MRARRFESADSALWDQFVQKSKNGLFLFYRKYMDYHADRFDDHSLICLDDLENVSALLPANRKDDVLVTHGGLTFGGVICDSRMTTQKMLEVFETMLVYAKGEGIARIIYKAIPHIYHTVPAEEDRYALFRHDAKLVKREVTSAVNYLSPLKLSKGRKCGISKARKSGVEVRQSEDFDGFMAIEARLLMEKYGTKPVHSADEITLLAERFPDNIKLYGAFQAGTMQAGMIVYAGANVAHVQYMATTEEGREIGALDLLVQQVMETYAGAARFFDFGISTEEGGTVLNAGLIAQKEMFGARAVVHETYELAVS